ncbi:MAG: glycosyltransferase family 4 protein [Thiobacillus sp.]|nr:glycosyltransferase family 4 protein [Thiobacillus sp.]
MTERLPADLSSSKSVRLFYAVGDFFPPWRLDVDELFSRQLPAQGLALTWAARRQTAGPCRTENYNGRPVWLPWRVAVGGTLGKALNKLLQYACELLFFFRLLLGPGFDIVQARDRRYFFAFLLVAVARLRGWRFVYWSSYPFPEATRETALSRRGVSRALLLLAHWFEWGYVYRFLMRAADHVFVQSEQMRRDVAAYGIPEQKMTPVPMGVPPELMNWRKHHPDVETVAGRVVYVGTLVRVRRLATMIESFALVHQRMPHARFVVVGDGVKPGERRELEELAQRLGIADVVTFTGFVPMDEAWGWAASAEICVSPFYPTFELRSTSPTKLVEYMALGRPVVVNDHPEQADVIGKTGAGICVEWGAAHFAEAITRLLGDPALARAMGSAGPAWVAEHRTYDKVAEEVAKRYRGILDHA